MSPQIIQLIIVFAQTAMQLAPELIKDGRDLIDLLTNQGDPSPEKQAEIDARVSASHEALQAKLAAVLKQSGEDQQAVS